MTSGDESATLVVEGLPRLEGERVYQAWLRRGEVVAPSSVFVLDSLRRGVAAIRGWLDGVDEVMVTQEPQGGSLSPTSEPILRGELR